MARLSYAMYALNDLQYFHGDVLPINMTAMACHEVVEKLLKHVLDVELGSASTTKDLLHTHKLPLLVKALSVKYNINRYSFRGLSQLNDFYFDGRYPGDSPFFITVDEINECIDCMNDVVSWFFQCVDMNTLFELYTAVTGVSDDISRFPDNKESRRLLLDLCGVFKASNI